MDILQNYLWEVFLILTTGINIGMMLPSKNRHTSTDYFTDHHYYEHTEKKAEECKPEGEECNTNKS